MPLPDPSRRALVRGSLEVMTLAVLADGRRHGYAIQKRIAAATGRRVPPATLYPLLHRLEADGLVEATWDGGARDRKGYTLTPAGVDRLKSAAADWQATFARMQGLVLPALRQVTAHGGASVYGRP